MTEFVIEVIVFWFGVITAAACVVAFIFAFDRLFRDIERQRDNE